jgi:hypothetical protein
VSWSAIGVANNRETVDMTDRESVGWEREDENGRDIMGKEYVFLVGSLRLWCVAGVRMGMGWNNRAWKAFVI